MWLPFLCVKQVATGEQPPLFAPAEHGSETNTQSYSKDQNIKNCLCLRPAVFSQQQLSNVTMSRY